MSESDARRQILARRAGFLAAALAGLEGCSAGNASTPAAEPAPEPSASRPYVQPCLSVPQPCLSVEPQRPPPLPPGLLGQSCDKEIPEEPIPRAFPIPIFEPGKATLLPFGMSFLDVFVSCIRSHPEVSKVRVEVGVSAGGDPESLKLSEERAQAIVGRLVSGGIPRERLVAVGFGKQRPETVRFVSVRSSPGDKEQATDGPATGGGKIFNDQPGK